MTSHRKASSLPSRSAASRSKVLARLRTTDAVFFQLTRGAAVAVLVLLGGIILSLVIGATPALRAFGFNFLVTQSWNPVTEVFGAAAPIYGTIVTSLIAMLIAVPRRAANRDVSD